MLVRTRAVATVAVLGAALLSASPQFPAVATTQVPTSAPNATAGQVPTVVAHVSKSAVRLSVGHRVRAGRVIFRVVTRQGGHTLQLLRLHRGYTLQQAGQDINKAFQGDVRAIRRVDNKITWLGGASTRPGHPGRFAVNLHAARLIALDQNGNALTRLRVVGTPPSRPTVPASSAVTTYSYGFGVSKPVLPRSGWTVVRNRSDQPHFVVFQHVKDRTTNAMVRRLIRSGSHRNPPWVLKANTSVGVISPYKREVFHYRLPAGKYLMACFWPDDDSGMPHFNMGMWKLLKLR